MCMQFSYTCCQFPPVNTRLLFLFAVPTANPGEQPDQPGEEEQRTGEPNGQTHPDLPAGRGEQNILASPCCLKGVVFGLLAC